MGIKSVNELKAPTMQIDANNLYYYTRVFLVEFDEADKATAGPKQAVDGIPVTRGDTYSFNSEVDLLSIAKDVSAEPASEDNLNWVVTVNYGPWELEINNVKYEWSHNTYTEAAILDAFGTPILNSAGDFFPDPIMVEKFTPVLNISVNRQTYDPLGAYTYIGACNSDTFMGAAPGTCRCTSITSTQNIDVYFGVYHSIAFQFEFGFYSHGKGHNSVLLDQGYNYIAEITNPTDPNDRVPVKRRTIMSSQSSNTPVLLDGTGKMLSSGANPVYKDVEIYPRLPFATLELE